MPQWYFIHLVVTAFLNISIISLASGLKKEKIIINYTKITTLPPAQNTRTLQPCSKCPYASVK